MKSSNNLAKQGFFMLTASTVVNATNFLFQFVMLRMLRPQDYGALTALFSLFTIISVPSSTIQTVITKWVSTYKAKKQFNKIHYLFSRSRKKLSFFGFAGFIFFTLLSGKVSSFLKIQSKTPVLILGILIGIALILPVGRGVLQGLQNFNHLGLNMVADAIFRLAFGVFFVFIGFGVSGALASSVFSGLIAMALISLPLSFLNKYKEKPVDFNSSEIYKYFWPVMITLFCFTFLTHMDVIIVKHFFSPEVAGYYSAAALLGKILLFLPSAFSMVLFSKASELHAQDSESIHVLNKTLLYVGLICLVVTLGFFAFPSFIIALFTGKSNVTISSLLGLFAIEMSLFSLINLTLYYNLSTHNLKFIPYLISLSFFQLVALWLFSSSLQMVLYLLIASASIILIFNLCLINLSSARKT